MTKSIESRVKVGAVLMIVMRWLIRLMGLFSVIILARILDPEDFGIMAMAMVFQGLIEGVINLNVELPLIRNQRATREHYDTAWTIKILQFGAIGIILFLAAGQAASFYDEPRLQAVIEVAALALAIHGLVNIGIVDFRKELSFGRDLQYNLIVNAVRVISTIGLAFWLRTYWAMVLGILAGSIAAVVVSYWMSNYRPRFCIKHSRDIMSVSAGVWLINLNRFFSNQADRLILGRLLPMSALGGYTMALELARLPSAELILPMSRAMVPGYAKVKHDLPRLTHLFRMVLRAATLLGAPIAFGFPLIAEDFTHVILGEKWLFIVPMLQIAAVLGVVELLGGTNRPLLLAAGGIRAVTILAVIFMLLAVSVIYPAFLWNGPEGVLIALTAVRFIGLLFMFRLSAVTLNTRTTILLQPVVRPLVAGSVMALLVFPVNSLDLAPVLSLVSMITLGAIVYSAIVYLLWVYASKPDGIERMVVDKIQSVFVRS